MAGIAGDLFLKLYLVILVSGKLALRACLHEGGGPQVGEVTCGGLPHLTCKRDHIKMRDCMDRRVTPPKRVTSPSWGPPPPCKQALRGSYSCSDGKEMYKRTCCTCRIVVLPIQTIAFLTFSLSSPSWHLKVPYIIA